MPSKLDLGRLDAAPDWVSRESKRYVFVPNASILDAVKGRDHGMTEHREFEEIVTRHALDIRNEIRFGFTDIKSALTLLLERLNTVADSESQLGSVVANLTTVVSGFINDATTEITSAVAKLNAAQATGTAADVTTQINNLNALSASITAAQANIDAIANPTPASPIQSTPSSTTSDTTSASSGTTSTGASASTATPSTAEPAPAS